MGNHPVRELDALAVAGVALNSDWPGHFPHELLPRLLHLDRVLPAAVPLLWPGGALPDKALADLQVRPCL